MICLKIEVEKKFHYVYTYIFRSVHRIHYISFQSIILSLIDNMKATQSQQKHVYITLYVS